MSAIVFRRSRFVRVAVATVFVVPVLYLLVSWLSAEPDNELPGRAASLVRDPPRLDLGECAGSGADMFSEL